MAFCGGYGDSSNDGGFDAEDAGAEVGELPTVSAKGIAFVG